MRTTTRLTRTLATASVAVVGPLAATLLAAAPAQASVAPPEPSRDCSVITRLSQADSTHVRVSTTIACDHTYTLNIALQVKRSGSLVYSHGRVCSAPSRSCTVTATVYDPSGSQTFSGFGLGKWGAVIPGKTGGSVIYTDTDAKSLVS